MTGIKRKLQLTASICRAGDAVCSSANLCIAQTMLSDIINTAARQPTWLPVQLFTVVETLATDHSATAISAQHASAQLTGVVSHHNESSASATAKSVAGRWQYVVH
eukprot:2037-Heterococcus_DN1.PRE.3